MRSAIVVMFSVVFLTACENGANVAVDARDVSSSPDGTGDGGASTTIAQLPTNAPPIPLTGLMANVDVVVDVHGWPHIYATSLYDAMMAEGYLAARDRMAQMDLVRRVGSGTLAEAFGMLAPTIIDQDLAIRVVGLRRTADQVVAMMPAGRTRTALQGYTDGVNAYLAAVNSGSETVPMGADIVVNSATPQWSLTDSVVVAWYQNFSLSYGADDEIAFTQSLQAATTIFDEANPVTDPDNAARAGFFWDTHRFASPSTATVIPDFYSGMGMMNQYRPQGAFAPYVQRSVFAGVQNFLNLINRARGVIAQHDRGSNNWVVAAAASASGHAMLENDPHLQLSSPPIWWGVHLTITGGPDALDVAGVAFPGLPGVTLGYNTHVAWGATVANYDLTDVYLEQITAGTGGAPDTVLFNGTQVPVQVIHEMVPNGFGAMIDEPIEIVPQHGPILPTISGGMVQPRTGTTALSVKWTGMTAAQDLDAIVGLLYANTAPDAMAAVGTFQVVSQNWVAADDHGNFGYSTNTTVPVRAPGALTWSPTNRTGTIPCAVLPGQGSAEWTGNLPAAQIPQAQNTSTRLWLNTSNNDQVGLSLDNNPVNDPVYLGCFWAEGWRAEEVQHRLNALGHDIALSDMQSVQNDHVLLVAGRYRPFLQQAMQSLQAEWLTPGSHPDLTSFATTTLSRQAALTDAAQRIADWTLDSPSGMEPAATTTMQSDAIATSIFHAWSGHVLSDVLDDEAAVLGTDAGDRVRGVLFLLEHPDQALTRDASTGQSVLWDDISTTTVQESRDFILLRALDRALTDLGTAASSSNHALWAWGNFHFVRFVSIVPGPGAIFSVPQMGDAMFPNGYPRPGDFESVDVANSSNTFPYEYTEGPSQRFTVDMDPAGPHGYTALPGGQSMDIASPHHTDEAQLWRQNQVHLIPRTVTEVIAAEETHFQFTH